MEVNSVSKPVGAEAAAVKPRSMTEKVTTEPPAAADGGGLAKRLVTGKREQPLQPKGGITLESVIGLDERTRIVDTTQAPWKMICALEIQSAWGNLVGTGWLVGPRTVITAGHCVYERSQMGGWAEKIVVRPGANGAQAPFGAFEATRFESTDRWLAKQEQDFDMGVIHLEEDVGDKLGWFSVASLPDEELVGYMVNVSGYPGDKGGRQQWWARNRVRAVTPRRIYYDVDTMGGQSGAAVYIVEDEKSPPKVVGIHAYGIGASKPETLKEPVNSAPRIIPEVVELIQQWIANSAGGSGS